MRVSSGGVSGHPRSERPSGWGTYRPNEQAGQGRDEGRRVTVLGGPARTSGAVAGPHGSSADDDGTSDPVAVDTPSSSLFGRGLRYVAVWALQLAASIVVFPALAHLLPGEEFGRLASAIALNQVLLVLAVVGLDQALIVVRTELGDRSGRSLLAFGLALAAAVVAVAAATVPVWSGLLGFSGAHDLVLVSLASTLPAAAVVLSSVLLLSQDRLQAFSVVNVAYGVGGSLAGMAALGVTGSRTAVTYSLGNLAWLVVTAVVALLLVRPQWRGAAELSLARRGLRLGLPLMVSSAAVYVLNAGDRLVIQSVLGATDTGRYQVAYNVGNIAILLLGMASTAWAPQLTAIRDEVQRCALISRSRDALLRLMMPVLLGLTLGAPLALKVAAPASFRPDELLLVSFLVAAAAFPVVRGNATARELITLGRTQALALAAIVAAVVNVGLNVVLLPVWGLPGAATATFLAFCAQTLLHRLTLPRRVRWPRTAWSVQVGVAGTVAAGAVTVLLLPQGTAWDVGRFVLALACVPWLVHELRLARAGDASAPAG